MLDPRLLHSATHRGSIFVKLRDDGFEPPKIDHIIYLPRDQVHLNEQPEQLHLIFAKSTAQIVGGVATS